MGKREREKGKRGELMLVHYLEKLGIKSHRGYVFLKQSDLVGIDGIHVECKYCEKLNARAALEQAIEEAEKRKDGLPVVFWKVTRKPWVCIMRTEDFATLYKLARKGEEWQKDECLPKL